MVHDDTCRLLGECDAGIQMAVSTIDEVLPMVESSTSAGSCQLQAGTQAATGLNRDAAGHIRPGKRPIPWPAA